MTSQQIQLASILQRIQRSADSHFIQTSSIKAQINASVSTAQGVMEAAGTNAARLLVLSAANVAACNANALIQGLTPEQAIRVLTLVMQPGVVVDPSPLEGALASLVGLSYQLAGISPEMMQVASPHVMTPNADGSVVVTAALES